MITDKSTSASGTRFRRRVKEQFAQYLKSGYSQKDDYTLDLLDMMLVLYPPKRINAQQALEHDYFVREKSSLDPQPYSPLIVFFLKLFVDLQDSRRAMKWIKESLDRNAKIWKDRKYKCYMYCIY